MSEIGQLANPPENCVENFGRCNSLYQSIFNGAENRPTAYLELLDYFVQDKEIGEEVFASLTRWVTLHPLSLLIIPSPDPAKRQVYTEQYLGAPLDDALAKQEEPQREASVAFLDYMFDKFRKYAKNDIKTYAIHFRQKVHLAQGTFQRKSSKSL